jgi:hypothetical protein
MTSRFWYTVQMGVHRFKPGAEAPFSLGVFAGWRLTNCAVLLR